jgi:hypothetical protein
MHTEGAASGDLPLRTRSSVICPAKSMIALLLQLACSVDFRTDLFGQWWISPHSNEAVRTHRVDILPGAAEGTINGSIYRLDTGDPILFSEFQVVFAGRYSGTLIRSFPTREKSEINFAESGTTYVGIINFDRQELLLTYLSGRFLITRLGDKGDALDMKREAKPSPPFSSLKSISSQEYKQWIIVCLSVLAVTAFGVLILFGCDFCCSRHPQKRKET